MSDSVEWDPELERYMYSALIPEEYLDPDLDSAFGHVASRFPELPQSDARPLFILSAGWRSGSTMLQRLLNTSPEVAVFGEVFEPLLLWNQLAVQWSRVSGLAGLHGADISSSVESVSADAIHDALTSTFVATLSPTLAHLREAHHAFLDVLLGRSARAMGRPRWGVKLVRSDDSVATYLGWLYPRAKFVFLCREPLDAWLSYEAIATRSGHHSGRGWHLWMPGHVIDTRLRLRDDRGAARLPDSIPVGGGARRRAPIW